jgi:serine/threonine protein kinase
VNNRARAGFFDEFVIGILAVYDCDEDPRLGTEFDRKGFRDYPYCIVMPAADRSLFDIIAKENIAGRMWEHIRTIGNAVGRALEHMHQKGYIHGDIKRK